MGIIHTSRHQRKIPFLFILKTFTPHFHCKSKESAVHNHSLTFLCFLVIVTDYPAIKLHLLIKCKYVLHQLRWTDTGSRIMAAILFSNTEQNIQKWLKIYRLCTFDNSLANFGQISAWLDEIFENLN